MGHRGRSGHIYHLRQFIAQLIKLFPRSYSKCQFGKTSDAVLIPHSTTPSGLCHPSLSERRIYQSCVARACPCGLSIPACAWQRGSFLSKPAVTCLGFELFPALKNTRGANSKLPILKNTGKPVPHWACRFCASATPPDECVDCEARIPECPVDAIFRKTMCRRLGWGTLN